jgi:hypothetical protein
MTKTLAEQIILAGQLRRGEAAPMADDSDYFKEETEEEAADRKEKEQREWSQAVDSFKRDARALGEQFKSRAFSTFEDDDDAREAIDDDFSDLAGALEFGATY